MYEQLDLMTFPTQTCGASASPARTSASQENKKACRQVSEAAYFMRLCDCLPDVRKKIDLNGFSSKMLRIYLALETDLISHGCSLKWGGYGYSLQWQVLNSKDYGVPQNRERVFIVCYLGNISGREVFPLRRTDGENPCELKEITQGVSDSQRIYESDGLARTLKGEGGGQGGKTGLYAVKCIGNTNPCGHGQGGNVYSTQGLAPALMVAKSTPLQICMSIKGQQLQEKITVTPTIDTDCRNNLTRKQTCCAVLTPDREEKRQNGRRIKEPGEPSFTLTAQDRHGVAIYQRPRGYNKGGMHDVAPALSISAWQENNLLANGIRIRRLTPRECWRLQGFPDEYFDKAKAAGISDTQLYKQAGNGVTVNVARAIGERLREIENGL